MSKQPEYNSRHYKVICNIVLLGTYLAVIALSLLLIVRFCLDHDARALERLITCAFAFLYITITCLLSRLQYHYAVAYLLVIFYFLFTIGIVWTWGINTPIGVLFFGLVIVLAGILLTARHALITAIVSGLILTVVQTVTTLRWHTPDTSWTSNESGFSDVLAYCTVFSMLALVSWLYNREVERSLAKAQQAEKALLQQKATLEMQVKKRTAQLQQVQLEEMQHMYRFAELGQLGVTLLHDLANHLTALTLEIEGMQSKQHTQAITRARRIIQYLGDIVDETRERLHGSTRKQDFNIIRKVGEVMTFLRHKAESADVIIDWQPPAYSWKLSGDPASLCQVVAIITSNAIDAYGGPRTEVPRAGRRVVVSLEQNDTHIIIHISDWGKGITKHERKHLFKPFHSTKKSGLGLGLFIAKQTVEIQFSGTITLGPQTDHTTFIIKLPRKHEK